MADEPSDQSSNTATEDTNLTMEDTIPVSRTHGDLHNFCKFLRYTLGPLWRKRSICAICRDEMSYNEFVLTHYHKPCYGSFHTRCLEPWLVPTAPPAACPSCHKTLPLRSFDTLHPKDRIQFIVDTQKTLLEQETAEIVEVRSQQIKDSCTQEGIAAIDAGRDVVEADLQAAGIIEWHHVKNDDATALIEKFDRSLDANRKRLQMLTQQQESRKWLGLQEEKAGRWLPSFWKEGAVGEDTIFLNVTWRIPLIAVLITLCLLLAPILLATLYLPMKLGSYQTSYLHGTHNNDICPCSFPLIFVVLLICIRYLPYPILKTLYRAFRPGLRRNILRALRATLVLIAHVYLNMCKLRNAIWAALLAILLFVARIPVAILSFVWRGLIFIMRIPFIILLALWAMLVFAVWVILAPWRLFMAIVRFFCRLLGRLTRPIVAYFRRVKHVVDLYVGAFMLLLRWGTRMVTQTLLKPVRFRTRRR